ncbi:uncharacterized protein C9orf85 homolog [Pelodytes ibericus]
MSSQRGNVQRSRPQKHRNLTVFKNDKYVSSHLTKKLNTKSHDGVCQRCKDVLEWRVKFSKYKPLTQPKKCVKCLQKTIKDSYHIICKPCAIRLEFCAKCGKKEDIVSPIVKEPQPEDDDSASNQAGRDGDEGEDDDDDDNLDFDLSLNPLEEDDDLPEENKKERSYMDVLCSPNRYRSNDDIKCMRKTKNAGHGATFLMKLSRE